VAQESSRGLSPSEWKIAHIIQELQAGAARDIYTITAERYGWSVGVTKTYLSRMVNKGHLTYTQVGNCYVYQLSDSVLKLLFEEGESLMEKVLQDARVPFLFHLVQRGRLPERDLQELQALLEDYRRSEKKKKKGG